MSTFRGQMEHVRLFQNLIELLVKYPFAIATIVVLTTNIFDKVQRSLLIGNRFIVQKNSLELYIIHFSLRSMIDKNHSFVTLTWFFVLSFCISWLLLKIKNLINSLLWKK